MHTAVPHHQYGPTGFPLRKSAISAGRLVQAATRPGSSPRRTSSPPGAALSVEEASGIRYFLCLEILTCSGRTFFLRVNPPVPAIFKLLFGTFSARANVLHDVKSGVRPKSKLHSFFQSVFCTPLPSACRRRNRQHWLQGEFSISNRPTLAPPPAAFKGLNWARWSFIRRGSRRHRRRRSSDHRPKAFEERFPGLGAEDAEPGPSLRS